MASGRRERSEAVGNRKGGSPRGARTRGPRAAAAPAVAPKKGAIAAPRRKAASGAPAGGARAEAPHESGTGQAEAAGSKEAARRRAARELDLLDRAEAAERIVAKLLSVVSHDLRNPLAVVLVSSRLLVRQIPEDNPIRKQIDAIARSADEMNGMIQDILDAMALRQGKLAIHAEPTEVAPVVESAAAALAPVAARRPVELVVEIAPGLPKVLADGARLGHALSNFLASALRYTPKNGRVRVVAQAVGDGVRLSVEDSGPGVPEPHRSMPSWLDVPPGVAASQVTSLGVFVAKGLVEAHGTRLVLETETDHGTTLSFTLPALREE